MVVDGKGAQEERERKEGEMSVAADKQSNKGEEEPQQDPVAARKRAMVWSREEAGPKPGEDLEAGPSPAKKQATAAAAEAEKEARLQKLAELRRKIEETERRVKEKRIQEYESLEHEERQLQEERQRKEDRKKKFEASFADVFESARKQFAEDLASKKAPMVFADGKEIDRILGAKSDYAVLQLVPGTSGADLRKQYRSLCLSTHPDKNDHPRAMEAFRKVVSSYKSLSKYIS